MRAPVFLLLELWLTLLRVLPVPCRTGLVRIGHPDENAPVLLTGNYRLTVLRVRRALQGIDAWLLIANSRGINVWCAAAGGHLTHHDVISVIRTSAIGDRVAHRELVLPQLAATGIEERLVRARTGWRVQWGPVEAADIPAWLAAGRHKTPAMSRVRFPWRRRLEMASAWAFPVSMLTLLLVPWWPHSAWALIALVWGLSLAMFLAFPLYERWLHPPRRPVGWVLFNFGPHGLLLILWALFLLGLGGWCRWYGGDDASASFLHWALASLIVTLVLGLDLTGSTPTYKSGLHADRRLRIRFDPVRCGGAGRCRQVCPVGVFELQPLLRRAWLPGRERCVQCGACIVQCPCDALDFRAPDGRIVPPAAVRRYRLNLLGERLVEVPEER